MKRGKIFVCPICGIQFYRYPSQIVEGKMTTCSRTCAARYFRDKGRMVECAECQKPFWRTAYAESKGYGNYCSKRCWVVKRMTPFATSNKSWSPQQVREWKGQVCTRCGATENLELDHILARSLGGPSTFENCQTLCKLCNLRKFQLEDLPLYISTLEQSQKC